MPTSGPDEGVALLPASRVAAVSLMRAVAQPPGTVRFVPTGKKEQAAFNADALAVMSEEKANLEKLSKELANLKGTFEQLPHDITKVVSSPGKEAVVVETHPPVSGIRAARAYYATPWDSNGMDGGSKESLLKRYAADIAAIDAKISALKP